MKGLLMICLLLAVASSVAGEMDDLKQQQQRLQQLLNDIKSSEQQRERQKAVLERLQKQMECNWNLIQSYEVCEQLYQQSPQELLNCTTKAKDNAAKCLEPLRQ